MTMRRKKGTDAFFAKAAKGAAVPFLLPFEVFL